jgi:aldehyde:ferredoxin oxidoreductase
LKRVINHRLVSPGERPPPKPLLEPYSDCLPREECYVPEFDEMLEAYYAARDWDPLTGYPSRQKLNQLGLDFVVKELYSQ